MYVVQGRLDIFVKSYNFNIIPLVEKMQASIVLLLATGTLVAAEGKLAPFWGAQRSLFSCAAKLSSLGSGVAQSVEYWVGQKKMGNFRVTEQKIAWCIA